MRDRRVVVSGVEAHIERKMSKSLLNLLENGGDRVGVVDVRRSNVRVDDDIVSTIYRPVLAVKESIRFAFFMQLSAVEIARILDGRKTNSTFYPMIYGAEENDSCTDPKVRKKRIRRSELRGGHRQGESSV